MNDVGISLGKDCLPAGYGVTHGYRKTKENNYKTCPFDLMMSNYISLVKCIKEDFANFTNPDFLIVNKDNLIINTYYDFWFNHESPYHADLLYLKENWPEGPYHFVNNNYANFIKRYNKRITNFRNYLSDENNFITFILHPTNLSVCENNCKELQEALLLIYPNLLYRIIIIKGPIPHVIEKTNIVKIIEKGE